MPLVKQEQESKSSNLFPICFLERKESLERTCSEREWIIQVDQLLP